MKAGDRIWFPHKSELGTVTGVFNYKGFPMADVLLDGWEHHTGIYLTDLRTTLDLTT